MLHRAGHAWSRRGRSCAGTGRWCAATTPRGRIARSTFNRRTPTNHRHDRPSARYGAATNSAAFSMSTIEPPHEARGLSNGTLHALRESALQTETLEPLPDALLLRHALDFASSAPGCQATARRRRGLRANRPRASRPYSDSKASDITARRAQLQASSAELPRRVASRRWRSSVVPFASLARLRRRRFTRRLLLTCT